MRYVCIMLYMYDTKCNGYIHTTDWSSTNNSLKNVEKGQRKQYRQIETERNQFN